MPSTRSAVERLLESHQHLRRLLHRLRSVSDGDRSINIIIETRTTNGACSAHRFLSLVELLEGLLDLLHQLLGRLELTLPRSANRPHSQSQARPNLSLCIFRTRSKRSGTVKRVGKKGLTTFDMFKGRDENYALN
jgi:hypothetical protein